MTTPPPDNVRPAGRRRHDEIVTPEQIAERQRILVARGLRATERNRQWRAAREAAWAAPQEQAA